MFNPEKWFVFKKNDINLYYRKPGKMNYFNNFVLTKSKLPV